MLTGGAGIDTFFGGDDDDDIFARDLTPETGIDCGAGTGDFAQVDPVVDLMTGCGQVE